jgi:hypothetical protein
MKMIKYYGVSRGESGNYGIGDVVESNTYSNDSETNTICVGDEEVYCVFIIENGEIKYVI